MSADLNWEQSYVRLDEGRVMRTVEVNASLLVDVDDEGRALGIETLDRPLDMDHLMAVIRAARFGDAT